MSARHSLKIQGLPRAPRATMTASTPVCSSMAFASKPEKMSPLPMTGIDTAALTAPTMSQSARPR